MFSGVCDLEKRNRARWNTWMAHTSQKVFELEALLSLYKMLKPMNVVEIGSEFGGTLYYWLTLAQPGATVVSIDLYTSAVVSVHPEVMWQSWCPDNVKLHVLWGNSQTDEMRDRLTGIMPQVDFLFIDGDHTYEGAKADFERYGPLVSPGGLIAFHDLITPEASPHIGVGKLWREIQRAGYMTLELYADNEQDWGGIGVVAAV